VFAPYYLKQRPYYLKLEARTQRPRNKLVPAFSLRTYNPHNM